MKNITRGLTAKIIIILMLSCIFMPRAFAKAPSFSYTTADDAKMRALDCMMKCAFTTEWDDHNNLGAETTLMRWEKTIKIFVAGTPAKDDLDHLDLFIMEIATHCPNMPNIRVVSNEADANIVIYYGPLSELSKHVDYYMEGNWGAFSYKFNSKHEISSGKIGIATDVNDTASKRHLLREELVGLFGLTNDHYDYSDSILYQEWTTVGKLSDVDWLMMNMLYSPHLKCGMTAKEAYSVLLSDINA